MQDAMLGTTLGAALGTMLDTTMGVTTTELAPLLAVTVAVMATLLLAGTMPGGIVVGSGTAVPLAGCQLQMVIGSTSWIVTVCAATGTVLGEPVIVVALPTGGTEIPEAEAVPLPDGAVMTVADTVALVVAMELEGRPVSETALLAATEESTELTYEVH